MAISSEKTPHIDGAKTSGKAGLSEAYIDSLQDHPTGEGFKTIDYYLLALTGILIPALLLMWGID